MTDIALPGGTTDADRFARALAILRGPEVTAVDGSLVAEDLRVLGQLLADGRASTLRAVAQAHPGQATPDGILAELDEEYGLPDGSLMSVGDRQRRLLAKYRSRSWPAASSVIATVRAYAAEAALHANLPDDVLGTDPTAVFRFALLMSEAHVTDAALRAALDGLLAAQVSADEGWSVGRAGPVVGAIPRFRCARGVAADSRCDVDLLRL